MKKWRVRRVEILAGDLIEDEHGNVTVATQREIREQIAEVVELPDALDVDLDLDWDDHRDDYYDSREDPRPP